MEDSCSSCLFYADRNLSFFLHRVEPVQDSLLFNGELEEHESPSKEVEEETEPSVPSKVISEVQESSTTIKEPDGVEVQYCKWKREQLLFLFHSKSFPSEF